MSEYLSAGTYVIIPAFNEENSIGKVIADIPKNLVNQIVVVDNNSNDSTSVIAKEAGAIVLKESSRGYGNACLKGMNYLAQQVPHPQIVVFMDGDYSDHPEQLNDLLVPIVSGRVDMVIGSRALGRREKGSMTFPQRFGNCLATFLIRMIYGAKFTDLGPFRTIRYATLTSLHMTDKTYGWTVEMQVKVVKKGFRFKEVPVDYRKRIGVSKVSGTVKGSILAGYRIILTILKYL